ncbi:MAG TPA: FGGY-family carbohydrate kinase [Candidatus Hydrogenedentes bacterium]|jgi:xylulokinase|nr:FGGY-family carbohydrate kinase [Candidatus Hydrogenedentota bacterium]
MPNTRKRRSAPGRLLIGIDLGTTVLKACAFDADSGDVAAKEARRLSVKLLANGGSEQNIASLDRTVSGVLASLRKQLGHRWAEVAGFGVAAQGGSSIIADRNTGAALTPMVLWNDTRAHGQIAEIAERSTPEFWRRFTLRDGVPHGLGRLAWLQERAPALFTDAHIHIGAGEWLFHRLTGLWRQDPGNAIQTGAYNAAAQRLDPAAFALIGLDLPFVAPLRRDHETAPLCGAAARRLGLPPGIPVAGPYIDQEAGYLSTVEASSPPVHCSLGTAWVCNYTRPESLMLDSPAQLVLGGITGAGQLVVLPLRTGNPAWDWALRTFLDPDLPKAFRKAETIFRSCLVPPAGLVAVPHLAQRNPFFPEAFGAGSFWGIHTAATTSDLVRAVAAGMVFELAEALQPIVAGRLAERIVAGGGASKAGYLCCLIAALFPEGSVQRQREADWAVARGALYALAPAVAHAPVETIRKPRAAVCDAAQESANHYARVRESLNL